MYSMSDAFDDEKGGRDMTQHNELPRTTSCPHDKMPRAASTLIRSSHADPLPQSV